MPDTQSNSDAKSDSTALKHFYNEAFLKRVAKAFRKADSKLDMRPVSTLMPRLSPLEMKARVRLVAATMAEVLMPNGPKEDFPSAARLLKKVAASGELETFDFWTLTEFVQTYGLDHVDISLDLMKTLTTHFTAEWAIRPFIRLHRQRAMSYLLKCASDSNVHVRRWASEGSRPRLPWGERLKDFVADPKPVMPILERLKFDPELYVRKSVSNHLNDIAKDHPEFVVSVLKRWKSEAGEKQASKIEWTIRRALRTLIKNGHPGALKLIGVSSNVDVKILGFRILNDRIRLGERLDFEFEVQAKSKRGEKLVIDYILHFMKANGKTAPKVFKLKEIEVRSSAPIKISKSHAVKKITTRQYYAGAQAIEIQINGRIVDRRSWNLLLK